MKIELSRRIDMALWRNSDGKWHGVLHGCDGPVPDELKKITKDWIKVKVSAVLQE